jgi:hypothetical protein
MAANTLGFDWYEDGNVASHTRGTRLCTGATVNGTPAAGATTLTLAAAGNALTFTVGDTFQVSGCYSVNPETKVNTGSLQQFVVTAANTSSAGGVVTALAISPTIYQSGANQNMTGLVSGAETCFWGSPSTVAAQNLAFHKDAFTFVSADLVMPKGVDFAAREVHDGISVRIVRAYDINNDRFPCRIDVLYGWKTLYPQLAARISA